MSNTRRETISIEELKQYCIVNDNGCWVWQHGLANGYPSWRLQGRKQTMHRWVCFLTYGEPEPKSVAMHLCDNKPCINPEHLRWASSVENNRDREHKNRGRWRNHEAVYPKRGKHKNYDLPLENSLAVQKAQEASKKD